MELDTLQAQNEENITKLQDKEQQLEQREKELEDLRERLQAEKNVPNIVIKDEDESLAERERALEEKEQALKKEREKWEMEKSQNNIDGAVEQLEKLKLEVKYALFMVY